MCDSLARSGMHVRPGKEVIGDKAEPAGRETLSAGFLLPSPGFCSGL